MTTTPLLVVAEWLLLLVVPLLLLLRSRSRHRRRSSCNEDNNKTARAQLLQPPSPPGLPIIGHLHLVSDLPHVSLGDLAAKHAHGGGGAGLMLLRLGSIPALVVSSPRAAEAIMRTHDHLFASRPTSTVSDDLLYGSSDIAFSPYGEHWRQVRKLVTTHLFTVKKVHSYCRARKEEVSLVLAKVQEAVAAGTTVDMSTMMTTFANDIVSRTVSGNFFRAEGRNKLFRELVEANSVLLGGFNIEDYFPELARTLGFLRRKCVRNRAQETHKRWDELLETILSDHERRDTMHRHDGDDLTDVLLSVQKEYDLTRDHVKAILIVKTLCWLCVRLSLRTAPTGVLIRCRATTTTATLLVYTTHHWDTPKSYPHSPVCRAARGARPGPAPVESRPRRRFRHLRRRGEPHQQPPHDGRRSASPGGRGPIHTPRRVDSDVGAAASMDARPRSKAWRCRSLVGQPGSTTYKPRFLCRGAVRLKPNETMQPPTVEPVVFRGPNGTMVLLEPGVGAQHSQLR